MNKRANSTRANESPTRILEAALEPGQGVDESGEPRTEEQDKAACAARASWCQLHHRYEPCAVAVCQFANFGKKRRLFYMGGCSTTT
jgi:hypothetical protein